MVVFILPKLQDLISDHYGVLRPILWLALSVVLLFTKTHNFVLAGLSILQAFDDSGLTCAINFGTSIYKVQIKRRILIKQKTNNNNNNNNKMRF